MILAKTTQGESAVKRLLLPAFCAAFLATAPIAAAADHVIILDAALSLSGKSAPNGAHTKNGYDLALRRVNKRGGIAIAGIPYELVIKYYDDESTPARGTELAERLIKQDGVKYLLGPFSSGQTKAILPVIEKYRAPMVEANGAARELFTKGYRYIFAVLSTSDQFSHRPSSLPRSMPRSLARSPRRSNSRSPWRTTRSPRMFAPACWTTSNGSA
ncbi:MAG: ABC transporter substrate-binding protein [Methyloceanibacter sp.]|uniref:ABC transporter substrate-binding protein n=1 Tax=Methyloceanibacter sp. TaxID=1965321 RepID=UPI003D9B8243